MNKKKTCLNAKTPDELFACLETEPHRDKIAEAVNHAVLKLTVFNAEKLRRQALMANLKTLVATMTDGLSLKMRNGMTATLRRLDNPLVSEVACACERLERDPQWFRRANHFAAEIRIDNESVHLVFNSYDSEFEPTINCLRGKEPWANVSFMVYNNTGYYLPTTSGNLLAKALNLKLPPGVVALMQATDCKP